MDYISIIGIGAISNLGNDADSIWENLINNNKMKNSLEAIQFDSGLSMSQKKRSNRYSEMGVYSSKVAISDSKVNIDNMNKTRIGTVFTTGYGPIVSTLEFSKNVVQGDSEFCSPTIFANSVNNSCVGHICIMLGFKGVSTVLMGSNNLEYSQMLINKGNTDLILTGSIEENCKELIDALAVGEHSKNVFVKEGAVSFLISRNENIGTAYCNIVDFSEFGMNGYPLTDKIDERAAAENIERISRELGHKYKIDAFFSSCNGSYFDEIELQAVNNALGNDVIYVNNVKKLFGETLGSAFNLNIMVGALCVKNGRLPLKLDSDQREIKRILVSGYDVSGNYMLAVLESRELGGKYA